MSRADSTMTRWSPNRDCGKPPYRVSPLDLVILIGVAVWLIWIRLK